MTSMRMGFLLISDTRGKLGIIDELTAHVQADAVIHAGDFGFYDDGSYERLLDRASGGWTSWYVRLKPSLDPRRSALMVAYFCLLVPFLCGQLDQALPYHDNLSACFARKLWPMRPLPGIPIEGCSPCSLLIDRPQAHENMRDTADF